VLHYLFKGIEFADLVPAFMRHLNVLSTHEHHISNVEEVNPIQPIGSSRAKFSRKFRWLRYTKLVSLRLSVHVVVSFETLDFFDGLEA
jgi:hypothetical protein